MKKLQALLLIVTCLLLAGAKPLLKKITTGDSAMVSYERAAGNPEILFSKTENSSIYLEQQEEAVLHTALSILQTDVKNVFGTALKPVDKSAVATIIAGTWGSSMEIRRLVREKKISLTAIEGNWEAFIIKTIEDQGQKKLIIAGSDSRGTAYGLLELSRMIGVSPWEWWADAIPRKNDEDWGLTPWSTHTYEPDARTLYPVQGRFKGTIGPQTYARIFELLLRLRANSIWPAMHEVTMPFYFVEGNRQMAEKYGIFIGSSHCEPLSRNSATEWDLAGKGDYNYLTNKENIIAYWSDRLKDLKNSNNIFTIGMRGKHDGPMQGVKTTEEYKNALEEVLPDQAGLLEKYIHPDITKIPQMLIPYKEILDVYKAGLNVPDYVTLMWCDDNYGYITHFPDEKEQQRTGGNGVYYHASYWGRPHDYLWLGTASPALLYQQMKLAYDKHARKIWILNVGDIKPIEYQTELFLDMAWNIDKVSEAGVTGHLESWLEREFGENMASGLLPVMQEYYRLAFIRKPEFMGNTREEERDPSYKVIKDLPWSEEEIRERQASYDDISQKAQNLSGLIPPDRRATYFELIRYPVQAAAQMNNKLLYAQLARHGKSDWQKSHSALDSIAALTKRYNSLNNGKWNKMMHYRPRNLPVFQKVSEKQAIQALPLHRAPLYIVNGAEFSSAVKGVQRMEGLGYQAKAISLEKGSRITCHLEKLTGDSVLIEVRLLPNHPVEGDSLRFSIALNKSKEEVIEYRTYGRSEEWKENVLRNQAIRTVIFPVAKKERNELVIKALDEGVVIDQVVIYKR